MADCDGVILRTHSHSIRYSEQEWEWIKREARKRGMKTSEYERSRILRGYKAAQNKDK